MQIAAGAIARAEISKPLPYRAVGPIPKGAAVTAIGGGQCAISIQWLAERDARLV
jgi:hypothetical protein